jgi:DNA polymerase-1
MPFFAPPKTFLIIDSFNSIFRSHYAYKRKPLTCKIVEDGEERTQVVSALYGTLRIISSAIQNYKPDNFVVVLDSKGGNFRHELFPEYKKQRKPIPEELPWQINKLKEILPTLGWPVEAIKGYEADDIIATIVSKIEEEEDDYETYIMSQDKDLLQLVTYNVKLITRSTNNPQYQRDGMYVQDRYNLLTPQFRDYLALKGDASDNLPGIKGVGEKTATKLLNKYGDLEGILENADKIKGKIGKRLQEGADTARLMYKLVGLKTDAPISPLDEYVVGEPTEDALRLLSELGFVSLIESMGLAREF